MKVLGGVATTVEALIRTGHTGFQKFIKNFLLSTKYNNEEGRQLILKLLHQYEIEPNEDSVLLFLSKVQGEMLGLLLIEDNGISFQFASGTMAELEAMARYEEEK
jgi:hypothetical protein